MNLEATVNLQDNVTDINLHTIPYSIPQYMTSLVLPKCVMVHGEVLSTIYLQVALNICHQKDVPNWKKKAFWMKSKTIAANTGYNFRSINAAINKLEQLKLFTVTINKNGTRSIRLNNHQLKNHIEIEQFNTQLNTILLTGANKTKTAKLTSSFQSLEDVIDFKNPFSLKQLPKVRWFPDVKLLRNWMKQAEKIYKGSSLFFINHMAPRIFSYIESNKDNSLRTLSEKQRAISVGSSQSTINRYIDAYEKSGCISISKNGINTPAELILNKGFQKEPENIEKRVVVCAVANENSTCPVCQKDFMDYRTLSVHLSKTKDKKHFLLNTLKKQTRSDDLHAIYNEYKEDFDAIDSANDPVEEKQKPVDEYLNVPSTCQMSCKECRRVWKLDFYDDCNQERKAAYVQEYGIQEKETEVAVKKDEQNTNDIEIKKVELELVPPIEPAKGMVKTAKARKKPEFGPDTAPGLVGYFYNLTGGFSPNPAKESKLVKNAMNQGVTPDGVRTTMQFLKRKGQADLRFFNNSSIREAHMELELMAEAEKEGTEAFLVKMYYDGLGIPLNVSTIVKDVQKIKETMNGIDYETTKQIVQYLIDVKCPTLNFIISKRNEALAKMSSVGGGIAFRQNASFFDRDELQYAKQDLISASRKLTDLREDYGDAVIDLAKKMFKESNFVERLTHFEWAWKIGLELDSDMYKIADENRKSKKFRVDTALTETDDQDRINKIIKMRDRFYSWLEKQQEMFGTAQ